tara:strand:+ start:3461 stop:3871 length:411 start_codon:yes stop_codon:yes gene_type:complete
LNQAFSESGSHSEVPELSIVAEFDQFKVDPGARLSLQVRVLIPEGWHLYSIHGSEDGDYIPTRLEAFSKVHQLNGPLREKSPILEWDAVLEKEVLLIGGNSCSSRISKFHPRLPKGFRILRESSCSRPVTTAFVFP